MDNDLETNEEVNTVETEDGYEFRRKRVKRIKGIIIILLVFFLIVPNVICGILLVKLYQMNQNIETLREEIKLSQAEIERRTKESAAASANVVGSDDENKQGTDGLVQLHLSDEEKYPGKQLVYLTFDDGPSKYTDEILDILKEHNVKATFFVLAQEGYDEQYKRILDEGHTLAMHSYTHKYSVIYASLDSFKEDVTSLSDFLVEKTGVRPVYYRFPGGSSNTVASVPMQDMLHFLSSEGYVYQDWNVSSEDASREMKETSVIARNVINGVDDNHISMVLMHDAVTKRTTVEALPIIIETLQQKGNVEFLPITEGTKQIYHVKEEVPGDDAGTEAVSSQSREETAEETLSEEAASAENKSAEEKVAKIEETPAETDNTDETVDSDNDENKEDTISADAEETVTEEETEEKGDEQ